MNAPHPDELGLDPANESPFKGKTGLRRVWNAFRYSLDGLKAAYLCEDAFRQETWLALVLIPLALWLPVEVVALIRRLAVTESGSPARAKLAVRGELPEMGWRSRTAIQSAGGMISILAPLAGR